MLANIMMGDTDCILDLWDWGNASDGTQISGTSRSGHTALNLSTHYMTWRFELISDALGERLPATIQAPIVDHRAEEIIKSQAAEITFLRQIVQDNRQEVSRLLSHIERLQGLVEGAHDPQRLPNNMT
ncbi:unnamed protein product [Rhizoctonia solani]|uniref:Uncharacterized protein n=1 Tax=Rhizoctonia solani TaxID=456999 RepID=A0A8H3D9I8_9AGAM|nr:unnamed protein product [Rhizoctonia solani]